MSPGPTDLGRGGALAASVCAFVFGALFGVGALGLLLIAQAFPLCTDT